MRLSFPHLLLGLAVSGVLFGSTETASAYYPPNNGAQQYQQQIQRMIQQRLQQQRQYQQQLARAVQQRNQNLVKQYQEQAKKRAEAYKAELKKLQDSGLSTDDIRKMQRDAILAQLPRSQRSAMTRKWAREDRLRQRAIARAKRTGQPVPADEGGLDLGGLEDLKLE